MTLPSRRVRARWLLGGLLAVGFTSCGGEPFGAGNVMDGGAGGAPADIPEPEDDAVEPLLDVPPSTLLSELNAEQRQTLCADVLRVFNADVNNIRYRQIYCTDLAYREAGSSEPACSDAYDACVQQLPRHVLSEQAATLGCDFNVSLDNACVTVAQTLACWRAFGVEYERGFLEDSSSTPRSCEQARENPPQLSTQVGFSLPAECVTVSDLADACGG
jgi:hypothetical protein